MAPSRVTTSTAKCLGSQFPTLFNIAMSVIGLLLAAICLGVSLRLARRRTWIKVGALVVNTAIDNESPGYVQLTVTYPVKIDSIAGNPANAHARAPSQCESVVDLDRAMCKRVFGIEDFSLRDQLLKMPIDVWYAREYPSESYTEEQIYRKRLAGALVLFGIGAAMLFLTASMVLDD